MSDVAKFGENQGHADSTQPRPIPTVTSESVTDAVIADMQARRQYGIGKYGVELVSFNGRDPLTEIYQELLDATMYVKQQLMERANNGKEKGTATGATT